MKRKNILKAIALVAVAFFVSSCCDKITSSIETKTTTRVDSHAVKVAIPDDTIEGITSDTLAFNIMTFCDSVKDGLIIFPYVLTTSDTTTIESHTVKDTTKSVVIPLRRITATVVIDSTGKAVVTCHEDAWIRKSDSLTVISTEQVTLIESLQKMVTEKPFYQFYKNGFFVVAGLLILTIGFLILKNK